MRELPTAVAAVATLLVVAALDQTGAGRDGQSADDVGPLGRLAGSLRGRMLDVVGPDEIVERVDVNAVLERVDVNEQLGRVDVDGLLGRVDVNEQLGRVDIDGLLGRVDVDRLLARVDLDRLIARVDLDRLLARVDLDRLLARVDLDEIVARVDVDLVLERVDVDALLARVDANRLLERVDVDAVMERVDIERLVQRAGIPAIVAESTGSLAESTLDLFRRQLVALDVVANRAINRMLARDESTLAAGPGDLISGALLEPPAVRAPITDATGRYAGGATRLVAFAIDTVIASATFTVGTAALGSALRFVGAPVDGAGRGVLAGVALVGWLFAYWWASTAIAGRTPGMAIVGLRIVSRSGEPLTGRQAFLRVLTMPLSFAVFGVGLLGVVFDREHRALHDVFASSTVVFDWGDRKATLSTPLARWLARHGAPVDIVT